MVSSVSRVISAKTFQVLYQRHIKPSFIKLLSRNQKLCSNSSTKMGKNKKLEKNFLGYKMGTTNRGKRGYKQWQLEIFQIRGEQPNQKSMVELFSKIVNFQLLTFSAMCSKNTSVACKERRNKLSYMIYLNFIHFPVLQTLNKLAL